MTEPIENKIDLLREIRKWQHNNKRDDSLGEAQAQIQMMLDIGLIHIVNGRVYPQTRFSVAISSEGYNGSIKHFQPMNPKKPWDAPSIEHFKD